MLFEKGFDKAGTRLFPCFQNGNDGIPERETRHGSTSPVTMLWILSIPSSPFLTTWSNRIF